jgi:hypothetical protein
MRKKAEIKKYDANVLDTIGKDGDLLSLTDLWKIAGSPKSKNPNDWLRQDIASELVNTVSGILNTVSNRIIKTKRGKLGGSYAHRQIVLAYAKYLDPALHVLVNEVFFQRIEEEKNPDLIGQRYIKAYKKRGKDNKWISERLKSIDSRNEFTKTLAAHGVTGEGYRNCTNAIYEPLYGGTASVVREKKGLIKGQSVRDNMSRQMSYLKNIKGGIFTLTKGEIDKKDIRGNGKCEVASRRASRSVANALIDHKKYII